MTSSSGGPDQPEDPAAPGTPEPDAAAPLPDYWEQRFGNPAGEPPAAPYQAPTAPYQPPAAPYQAGGQYPAGSPYQAGDPYQAGGQPPGPYQAGAYQPPAAPYQPGYQPTEPYPAGYQQPYPGQPGAPDVYLANPYLGAPPARKAGPGRKLIAGGAVLAVLAAGAVAAYAYTTLASGGTQPEKVLPATTVAFAKLDLDPAANQKIAAYRLSAKFPKVAKGAGNLDEERHALLSSFFDDQSDLDYDADIKPWLGDRIAVAAVPDRASKAGLDPVLAMAYKDEAKMKAALGKAARTEPDFGYVTVDGYALISDSQAHADTVLAAVRKGTLAKSEQYQSDVKSLHGDQIALGWADVAAAVAAVKAGAAGAANSRIEDLRRLDSLAARGRIVIGAHASSDYLEVAAVTHGAGGGKRAGSTPVNGTLAKLPAADTRAALEVTGLGSSLSDAWDGASAALGLNTGFQDFVDQTGLRLPGDLTALFGTDTTVSVRLPRGGDPEFAAQVSTDQADRALQLLDSLGQPFGFPVESLHPRRTADGYLISTNPDYDPRAAGGRALGDDPAFKKAVPDRAKAGLIGYVDLGGILDADPDTSAQEKADWKHVGAIGLSVVPTPDGSRMTFRLTTR